MITLIDRESVFRVKPEAMNEKVKRDSEIGTIAGRSYAKGWNACLKMWHEEIEKIPLVERTDGNPIVDIYIGNCSEIPNSSTDCIRRQMDLIDRKRALEEMTFSGGIEQDCVLYVPLRDVNNHLKSLPSEAYLQTIATERYEDLCEYFGNQENPILTDQREFKRWLDRVKWHFKKVDELARWSEDEWCTDCPAYDHEKHYCPRYNRVIRETVKEMREENKWIHCNKGLPTEDGYYLVTLKKGYAEDYGLDLVTIALFDVDYGSFGYWHEYFDPDTVASVGRSWDEIPVIAWKHLSEPWEGEQDEEVGEKEC